jgi:hypothetical protein
MRYLIVLVILLCALLTGCALIPTPVEYFQDRVRPVPERSEAAEESLRQAARLAAERAAETERAALTTEAAALVLTPARDTAVLTGTVSDRLGPPSAPWRGEIEALVARMDAQEARYQRELSIYREAVQENVGKPIEGTGAIQVGYFTHLLILAAIFAAAWMIVRIIALFNAPVSVGLKTVEGGTRFLGRALAEVVEAGQDFKTRLRKRLADQPNLAESILNDFRDAHRASQSRDVQRAVVGLKR